MARRFKYPFDDLQPGQTVHVRTTDTPAQMASAAWRAGARATERRGTPTRFSVRRVSEGTYALSCVDPSLASGIEAELVDTPTLTPEQLQEQQDQLYLEKVRTQLRQKVLRAKAEAEMELELQALRIETEKARLLLKARARAAVEEDVRRIENKARIELDAKHRLQAQQREREIQARERRIVESLGPNATMDEIDAAIAKAALEDL